MGKLNFYSKEVKLINICDNNKNNNIVYNIYLFIYLLAGKINKASDTILLITNKK